MQFRVNSHQSIYIVSYPVMVTYRHEVFQKFTHEPNKSECFHGCNMNFRADTRLAPSQWETSLQSNAVSDWLGANLESALTLQNVSLIHPSTTGLVHIWTLSSLYPQMSWVLNSAIPSAGTMLTTKSYMLLYNSIGYRWFSVTLLD